MGIDRPGFRFDAAAMACGGWKIPSCARALERGGTTLLELLHYGHRVDGPFNLLEIRGCRRRLRTATMTKQERTATAGFGRASRKGRNLHMEGRERRLSNSQ